MMSKRALTQLYLSAWSFCLIARRLVCYDLSGFVDFRLIKHFFFHRLFPTDKSISECISFQVVCVLVVATNNPYCKGCYRIIKLNVVLCSYVWKEKEKENVLERVVVVVVEPLYISQFLFINETVSLSLKDLFLQ